MALGRMNMSTAAVPSDEELEKRKKAAKAEVMDEGGPSWFRVRNPGTEEGRGPSTATDAAAKFLDTASLGGLTGLSTQLAKATSTPDTPVTPTLSRQRVEQAETDSPLASGVAGVAGSMLPFVGASGLLARGGLALGRGALASRPLLGGAARSLASPGVVGQAVNQGITGAGLGGVEEAIRMATDPEHEFDPGKIGRQGIEGVIGGGLGAAARQLLSPASNIAGRFSTRAEAPPSSLPSEIRDPTGTIKRGLPVTGAEALAAKGSPFASEVQGLTERALERAPAADAGFAGIREKSFEPAAEKLSQLTTKAVGDVPIGEGASKIIGGGLSSKTPTLSKLWPDVTARLDALPQGAPTDSVVRIRQMLDQVRKEIPLQTKGDAAKLTKELALVEAKLPQATRNVIGAERAEQGLTNFRQGITPEAPLQPAGGGEPSMLGGAALDLLKAFVPGTRTLKSLGEVPGMLSEGMRPEAMAKLLQNPKALREAMAGGLTGDKLMALLSQLTQRSVESSTQAQKAERGYKSAY